MVMTSEVTTSDRLREAVRKRGLSLYELAKRTGVDHGILSRFLRGERTVTLETAEKLVAELNLVLGVNHTGSTWHNIYIRYSWQGAAEKVENLSNTLPAGDLALHPDATQSDWRRVLRTLRIEKDLRRALRERVDRVWYSAGSGDPEDTGSWWIEHSDEDSPTGTIMRRLVDTVGWLITKDLIDAIFIQDSEAISSDHH